MGLGWSSRKPPLLLPLRCMNILSAPMGATWPHLLLLRAHQLHTSGKGKMGPHAPAFPRPHPGCAPTLSPSRKEQSGWKGELCPAAGASVGEGGSDRSDAVTSGALRLQREAEGAGMIPFLGHSFHQPRAGPGSIKGSSFDQQVCHAG